MKTLALLLLSLLSGTAHAFCGFFVSGADTNLYNNASQVVLMRKGNRTVMTMSNNYKGPTEDFAMVVPVPVVLHKEDVKTLAPDVFNHIDQLSAPLGELARVVRPGGHIILSDVHPVSVALGAQGAFRDPDGGRAFVRNHVHWPSTYLSAFAQLGLELSRCLEPVWEEHDVATLLARRGLDVSMEAANAALVGLPAILIWDLVRT